MVKSHNITSSFVDSADVKKECCDDCEHKFTLPSRLISEIKEFLCISVGPRDGDEGLELAKLKSFFERLSQTLNCRKYITLPAEHHIARCTVELVSLLVSDQVPLVDFASSELCNFHENQRKKREAVGQLLLSVLTIWKKDFVVPIPIQLIFSDKNMKYFMDVHAQEQWGLFAALVQQLLELGLIQHDELEKHICRLQKYKWPLDLLSDLDQLALGSENYREPKDPKGILVPQTGAEIIAPS